MSTALTRCWRSESSSTASIVRTSATASCGSTPRTASRTAGTRLVGGRLVRTAQASVRKVRSSLRAYTCHRPSSCTSYCRACSATPTTVNESVPNVTVAPSALPSGWNFRASVRSITSSRSPVGRPSVARPASRGMPIASKYPSRVLITSTSGASSSSTPVLPGAPGKRTVVWLASAVRGRADDAPTASTPGMAASATCRRAWSSRARSISG